MGVRSEAVRVLRFSAVGTLAFCVDLLVFNLLRADEGLGPLGAKVVSVLLATTVSWLGSRYWTFRDGRRARAGIEALSFFAVNGVGMLIALACLWVSHYALGLTSALADNVSGTFVGVALGNLFRYAAYRWLVFRPPSPRRAVVVSAGQARPGAGDAHGGAEEMAGEAVGQGAADAGPADAVPSAGLSRAPRAAESPARRR